MSRSNGAAIPSPRLVELQFTPNNPYRATSALYSGRLALCRGMQSKMLRQDHPDAYYVNALIKYANEYMVEVNSFMCSMERLIMWKQQEKMLTLLINRSANGEEDGDDEDGEDATTVSWTALCEGRSSATVARCFALLTV